MRRPYGRMRWLAGGLVVALALGASACSSDDSKPERRSTNFAADYRSITTDYSERSKEIQRQASQAKGQGLERTLEVFEAIKASADDAAKDLRELPTPPEVQDSMSKLIQLLTQQSNILESLLEAGRKKDNATVATATTELTRLVTQFQLATQALDAAITRCGEKCT